VAQRNSQHVFGEYNVLDTSGTSTSRGKYVEIVGKGTADNARSNARTLDWSGNEVLAGKLTVGAAPTNNMDVATKEYVDRSIPTVPTNVSDLTNDSGFVTNSDVQDYLIDLEVGIDRIRYEFVPELPDLEDPDFVLPSEFTVYIVEGDGWYKINDAGDGWDKIHIGYSNYITTTDHTQETPEPNTIYYNTQNSNTYIYDGTNWRVIGYIQLNEDIPTIYTITESNGTYSISPTSTGLSFGIKKIKILKYNDEYYYQKDNTHFTTPLDSNKTYKEFTLNTQTLGNVSVSSFNTYSAAPTITNTLSSGTLIATINGTNIYAPSYTDADGVSY